MQITTTKPPLGWQTKSQYEKSKRKAAPPEEKQQRGKQLGVENARFNVRGVLQVEADSDSAKVTYKEEASKDARSQNRVMEEATIESKVQVKYKNDVKGERLTSAGIKAKVPVGGEQNTLSREKERTQEERTRRRKKAGSIEAGVSIIFKIGVFYKARFEGIEFFIVWPYAVFHKTQVVFYKSAHFMYL